MGSLAVFGLFAVLVLTAFGAVCSFGTIIVVAHWTRLGRAGTALVGALTWIIGSGAPLTLVLVQWSAPSPAWPYWRDDWIEVTATFVGTISVTGGVLGGLAFLLLRRTRA